MHMGKTWILIADGGHARILETIGIGNPMSQVQHMAFETDLPPSRELGTDQPGRTHESMGSTRHAIGEKTDPHRELKRAFAQEIATRLETALNARVFARLVIVAPPVTLGDLRHAMSKAVSDCIAGEVAKDLVKVPNDQIRSHLKDVVAIS
jgi:protein required for attachment to host cells